MNSLTCDEYLKGTVCDNASEVVRGEGVRSAHHLLRHDAFFGREHRESDDERTECLKAGKKIQTVIDSPKSIDKHNRTIMIARNNIRHG